VDPRSVIGTEVGTKEVMVVVIVVGKTVVIVSTGGAGV